MRANLSVETPGLVRVGEEIVTDSNLSVTSCNLHFSPKWSQLEGCKVVPTESTFRLSLLRQVSFYSTPRTKHVVYMTKSEALALSLSLAHTYDVVSLNEGFVFRPIHPDKQCSSRRTLRHHAGLADRSFSARNGVCADRGQDCSSCCVS